MYPWLRGSRLIKFIENSRLQFQTPTECRIKVLISATRSHLLINLLIDFKALMIVCVTVLALFTDMEAMQNENKQIRAISGLTPQKNQEVFRVYMP